MTWAMAALAAYDAYNGGSGRVGGSSGGGGGGSAPANPATATAGAYGSGLDASGWIVNFSGTTSASYAKQETPQTPAASSPPSLAFQPLPVTWGGMDQAIAPSMAGGATTWVLLGLLGVALWRMKRSKA